MSWTTDDAKLLIPSTLRSCGHSGCSIHRARGTGEFRETLMSMKTLFDKTRHARTLAAAAALFVCSVTTSQAAIVTWEATGQLTEIDRSGGLITEFATATVGTAFTVRYTFDTASALDNTRVGENAGLLYEWFNAIISSELSIGGETLGRARTSTLLRLRDDFAGSLNFSLPDTMVVDGITLDQSVASSSADGSAAYSIIFRGPEDLSLYSGSTLPEDPSPLLTLLSLNAFQFSDTGECTDDGCQSSNFTGIVTSLTRVGVPEPATLGLLGLGLIALGFARRKRV
jgi:hypothetical protein